MKCCVLHTGEMPPPLEYFSEIGTWKYFILRGLCPCTIGGRLGNRDLGRMTIELVSAHQMESILRRLPQDPSMGEEGKLNSVPTPH